MVHDDAPLPPQPPTLTSRQLAVLAFIASYLEARGYPPTYREIGLALSIKSTNGVRDHLERLTKKGFLARDPAISRGLRVLRRPLAA